IELLVAETTAGERDAIDVLRKQRVTAAGGILRDRRRLAGGRLPEQRLDFLVGVPLRGAFLENEVRPHAPAGEVADAVVILRAIGVRVEVARSVVPDIL